jgi:predicted ATPase
MPLPSFRYEDTGPLNNVECEDVPDLMVIAGPNGVGKSTLLDNIAKESQDHFATSRLYKSGELESFLNETEMPEEEVENIIESFEDSTSSLDDTNVAFVGPHRGMSKQIPIRERDLIGMPGYSTKFLHSLSRLSQGATRYWLNKGQGNFRSGMFGNEKGMLDELPYYEVRRRLAQIHSNIEEHVTEEFFEEGGEVEKPDILEWLSPLQEAIKEVLPGIELNGVGKTDEHEYVLEFENRDGSIVNFDDLSSGEKDAVALLFLLVEDGIEDQFKDSDIVNKSEDDLVVLYDSPEAYLHPQLQLNFLNYIKDYLNQKSDTDRKIQIIICTHSKMIVDNTPDESLYFLFYPSQVEENQLRPASTVPDELRELISNEMGLTALSSGEDILLVEGSDDREVIQRIDDEIEKELSVIGMGGKDPIVNLDETLNKMMDVDGVNVYAIVDGDRNLELDEETPDNIHSLPVTSVENLILKPGVMFETLEEILGRKLQEKGYNSPKDVDDLLSSIITDDDFIEQEAHTRWNEQFGEFYISYRSFEQSEGFEDIESFAENELQNRLNNVKEFEEIKQKVKQLAENKKIDQLQGKEILKQVSNEFNIKTERLLRMCAKKLDTEDLPEDTEHFLQKAKS